MGKNDFFYGPHKGLGLLSGDFVSKLGCLKKKINNVKKVTHFASTLGIIILVQKIVGFRAYMRLFFQKSYRVWSKP